MERNTDRTSLSLPPDTMRKARERAKLFRMKFSHYIGFLIERDYASGTRRLVIMADEKPGTEPEPDEEQR